MNLTLSNIPTVAKKIATNIQGGEIFALVGPLGSGKTTFVKALGKELKVRSRITSPTFTLLNSYRTTIKKHPQPLTLLHLDLYRTNSFAEVEQLGITEIWGKKQFVTCIEWADLIQKHLPKKTTTIYFTHET